MTSWDLQIHPEEDAQAQELYLRFCLRKKINPVNLYDTTTDIFGENNELSELDRAVGS